MANYSTNGFADVMTS